jgi:hypothetical protein
VEAADLTVNVEMVLWKNSLRNVPDAALIVKYLSSLQKGGRFFVVLVSKNKTGSNVSCLFKMQRKEHKDKKKLFSRSEFKGDYLEDLPKLQFFRRQGR